MFKKTLLLLVLGLSCHSLLPVKIQTGSNNANHEFIADGGEFELSTTELNQLKSALIDGIIEDTGIIGRDTIPLPINKQTFALLARMLDNTPVFNPERAESILRENTFTEFLPLFHALCFLNTTNTELCRVVAQHYLTIQPQITFENFVQHAQYITLFFQQDCVKELLANTAAPYTCLQILMGDAFRSDSMAFSPDGTKIATGSDGNTVKLWEVNSSQCLQIFTGHQYRITSIVFSPDGAKLATGSYDKTAKLWDVNTGQCLQTFNGHTGWVHSVAFSQDGTKLATGSDDKTVKLWDVNTGQCLQTFNGHTGWVHSVAFSPDGTKLATGSWDFSAKLWDVNSGKCLQTLTEHMEIITSVKFLSDGTTLKTNFYTGAAKLWAILDTAQQALLVWIMQNPGKFSICVSPFLDEVYTSLPEQLQQKTIIKKILTRKRKRSQISNS